MVIAGSGYRVIAYDRRGFGRSSQPWGPYDYDTLADDLATVITQTGAVDATLVGFSMGGGEVARYMSRHGGKSVVKAALISSIVPCMMQSDSNPHGVEQAAFDGMAEQMRTDRAQFFHAFFKDFFGVSLLSHPVSAELIDWARSQAMQASLRATLECAKSFATTDFRGELSAFTVPTLIIHGTDDTTVPIAATARPAHAGIAQSTLFEYEGAPHGIFATHKHRLSEDLLNFIRL
jgi:pimeloyl-ACP methyl ester carboxylesterase